MIILEMKSCNIILRIYDTWEVEKMSALLSDKIEKYEYLTRDKILPLDQTRVTKQDEFSYFPLGKFLEKQTKTIEHQGEKMMKF